MRQPRVRLILAGASSTAPPAFRTAASRPRWLVAAILGVSLCGSLRDPAARAQDPTPAATPAAVKADATAPAPSAPASTSLARYVPRDNLLFHLNFDGLDAHAEAWQKTAAYKMLSTTPLGAMLEEVAAQLLDRAFESLPNRRITGTEAVTLIETVLRKGAVFAVSLGKDGKPDLGVFVLRGMAAKETRLLSSKVLGMIMGTERPKTERKAGRFLVTIPGRADVWWAEKDDIVLCSGLPTVDQVIATLDGKAPSTAENPVLAGLVKPEGTFRPVLTCFMDMKIFGESQFKDTSDRTGITRLDYRWGFDDDALMSVLTVTAPAPRKPALAMFDQPKLDLKQIIPVPEGVESFAMVSASPEKILSAIAELGPPGEMRARLDELMEKLKGQTKLNVEKDFLGNLGPRMAFYLSPSRSAAATEESPNAGANPMAMLSSLQNAFPKPTLVAELRDPVAFGKALDSVVIAVNKELKAMAVEKAAAAGIEDSTAAARPDAAQGRGGVAGGEGTGRRRSNKDTPAPAFQLSSGPVKNYMLVIPPDSPIKLNMPGVRPTIRVDGKFIAISTTSEAARVALEAARKKDWKPTPDVARALDHTPANSILVAVDDSRSTTPTILASLPGILQTQINTIIALGAAQQGQPGQAQGGYPGQPQAGYPGQPQAGYPGQPQGGSPGAPTGTGAPLGNRKLGRMGQGGPNAEGLDPGGQPPSGYPGAGGQPPAGYPGAGGSGGAPMSRSYPGMGGPPQPGGNNANANAAPAMIEIKVDPAKLPKAEDLKDLMFPGTMSVSVDDQAIKVVTRESFPNLVVGLTAGGAGTALLMPAIQSARKAAKEAADRKAAAAGAAPEGGQAPAAGFPGARPGAPQGPGGRPGAPQAPGGQGGRGRRGEGPVD